MPAISHLLKHFSTCWGFNNHFSFANTFFSICWGLNNVRADIRLCILQVLADKLSFVRDGYSQPTSSFKGKLVEKDWPNTDFFMPTYCSVYIYSFCCLINNSFSFLLNWIFYAPAVPFVFYFPWSKILLSRWISVMNWNKIKKKYHVVWITTICKNRKHTITTCRAMRLVQITSYQSTNKLKIIQWVRGLALTLSMIESGAHMYSNTCMTVEGSSSMLCLTHHSC